MGPGGILVRALILVFHPYYQIVSEAQCEIVSTPMNASVSILYTDPLPPSLPLCLSHCLHMYCVMSVHLEVSQMCILVQQVLLRRRKDLANDGFPFTLCISLCLLVRFVSLAFKPI